GPQRQMHLDVEDFEPLWRHASKNERKRIDRHFGAWGGQERVAGAFLNRQFVYAQSWRVAILDDCGFPEAEFIATAETLVEGIGDLRPETFDRQRPQRDADHEETAANERQKSQSQHQLASGPGKPRGPMPSAGLQPNARRGIRRSRLPAQPISQPGTGPGRLSIIMLDQPLAAFQKQA